MQQFVIAAALFAVAMGGLMPAEPTDVSTLCAATTCEEGSFCRVVNSAAACLTCVPAGSDEVCNANSYWNTLLSGEASALTATACDDVNACAAGATCVANVCCFGLEEAAEGMTVGPVVNGDARCPM